MGAPPLTHAQELAAVAQAVADGVQLYVCQVPFAPAPDPTVPLVRYALANPDRVLVLSATPPRVSTAPAAVIRRMILDEGAQVALAE